MAGGIAYIYVRPLRWTTLDRSLYLWQEAQSSWAEFKEKPGIWDSMLELITTSPYIIVDSEVQLTTRTTMNAEKCFANYSKTEQPIVKGRVRGRGEGRVWDGS